MDTCDATPRLSIPRGESPAVPQFNLPSMPRSTRLWCTYQTKDLIREHKRPKEIDDDVLRRLALEAPEPESVREQLLSEDRSDR